ncbi:MAG: type II toxin-antitoxin system VapC family toxin [Anaerolineae bacterium]
MGASFGRNLRLAVSLARKYEITVYDATFIALAELLKATFVTADKQLTSMVTPLPFVHLLGE